MKPQRVNFFLTLCFALFLVNVFAGAVIAPDLCATTCSPKIIRDYWWCYGTTNTQYQQVQQGSCQGTSCVYGATQTVTIGTKDCECGCESTSNCKTCGSCESCSGGNACKKTCLDTKDSCGCAKTTANCTKCPDYKLGPAENCAPKCFANGQYCANYCKHKYNVFSKCNNNDCNDAGSYTPGNPLGKYNPANVYELVEADGIWKCESGVVSCTASPEKCCGCSTTAVSTDCATKGPGIIQAGACMKCTDASAHQCGYKCAKPGSDASDTSCGCDTCSNCNLKDSSVFGWYPTGSPQPGCTGGKACSQIFTMENRDYFCMSYSCDNPHYKVIGTKVDCGTTAKDCGAAGCDGKTGMCKVEAGCKYVFKGCSFGGQTCTAGNAWFVKVCTVNGQEVETPNSGSCMPASGHPECSTSQTTKCDAQCCLPKESKNPRYVYDPILKAVVNPTCDGGLTCNNGPCCKDIGEGQTCACSQGCLCTVTGQQVTGTCTAGGANPALCTSGCKTMGYTSGICSSTYPSTGSYTPIYGDHGCGSQTCFCTGGSTCSDPDGTNTGTAGTCTSSINGAHTDTCSGTGYVLEYTCNPSKECLGLPVACPSGQTCFGGKCTSSNKPSRGTSCSASGTCASGLTCLVGNPVLIVYPNDHHVGDGSEKICCYAGECSVSTGNGGTCYSSGSSVTSPTSGNTYNCAGGIWNLANSGKSTTCVSQNGECIPYVSCESLGRSTIMGMTFSDCDPSFQHCCRKSSGGSTACTGTCRVFSCGEQDSSEVTASGTCSDGGYCCKKSSGGSGTCTGAGGTCIGVGQCNSLKGQYDPFNNYDCGNAAVCCFAGSGGSGGDSGTGPNTNQACKAAGGDCSVSAQACATRGGLTWSNPGCMSGLVCCSVSNSPGTTPGGGACTVPTQCASNCNGASTCPMCLNGKCGCGIGSVCNNPSNPGTTPGGGAGTVCTNTVATGANTVLPCTCGTATATAGNSYCCAAGNTVYLDTTCANPAACLILCSLGSGTTPGGGAGAATRFDCPTGTSDHKVYQQASGSTYLDKIDCLDDAGTVTISGQITCSTEYFEETDHAIRCVGSITAGISVKYADMGCSQGMLIASNAQGTPLKEVSISDLGGQSTDLDISGTGKLKLTELCFDPFNVTKQEFSVVESEPLACMDKCLVNDSCDCSIYNCTGGLVIVTSKEGKPLNYIETMPVYSIDSKDFALNFVPRGEGTVRVMALCFDKKSIKFQKEISVKIE